MPEQPAAPSAVFLSYAREDAEAARRIADALRAFGVEVWFDQNELRGGDSWDAKIKKQIRECALFVPIVSGNTQARGEGYFRREWKLAVERTHDMAAGVPFLLPLVIDDTPESGALVPDELMRVQWTRLARGVPTPQFVEQVKRLLEGPGKSNLEAGRPRPATRGDLAAPPRKPVIPVWMWAVLVVVIAAVGVGIVTLRKPGAPAAPPPAAEAKPAPVAAPMLSDKSIAVLPFTNMSEDKDNAFFTDGIHEDILTNLALIHELRVVSRTSVMSYRATTKPMRQIAQELGVAYILEGSVRREGNKVRVTGQLIHAATDEHVWAQAYDRDLTDVFAIQAELSQQIAAALKAALSPEEKILIAHRPTENTAAYDLFLKARDVRNREGNFLGPLQTQEALLEGAVALDPAFASAWGELAGVHALFSFWGLDATEARQAKAKAAMDTALRLAPDMPDVVRTYGTYLYYGFRDYVGAAQQYARLAQMLPNDPTVYSSLGLIQRRQGHFADSLGNLRRATQLDPANASYARNLAEMLTSGRRYDEALAERRRIAGLLPDKLDAARDVVVLPFLAQGSTREADDFFAHLPSAQADSPRGIELRKQWAQLKGDYAEAIRLDRLQPYFDEDGLEHYIQAAHAAYALAGSGDMAAARARIGNFPAELHARLEREPANVLVLLHLAILEALLDHREEAVRFAQKAVEIRPESGDAVDGPVVRGVLCQVYAWTGDKDRALVELAHVLRTPFSITNVHAMKVTGYLAPLHGDPRFEALCADPANNAPLF